MMSGSAHMHMRASSIVFCTVLDLNPYIHIAIDCSGEQAWKDLHASNQEEKKSFPRPFNVKIIMSLSCHVMANQSCTSHSMHTHCTRIAPALTCVHSTRVIYILHLKFQCSNPLPKP